MWGFLRGRPAAVFLLGVLAILLVLLAVGSDEIDFRAYYVAAEATANHLDPYLDNHLRGEQFTDVSIGAGISRWIYPPPALFFVTPLAWSSFTVARVLFDVLSIGAMVWILLLLGRRFKIPRVWLVLAFVSLPVVACVRRGQVDILILLCMVLAYRFAGRYWGGIALGIAVAIKIFPAALLLWWLLERRFKGVAIATAVTIGLALLAAWRFGLSSYTSFLHNLTTLHSQGSSVTLLHGAHSTVALGGLASPHFAAPMFSLRAGFVGSYINPLILFDNGGIVIGFVLTVAAAFLLRYRRVPPEIGFFSMVLVSQLMNTTLWTMGLVMYIPICLIALGRSRSYVVALFLVLPLYLPSQIRIFDVSPRFVLALLIVSWVAARTCEPRESRDAYPVPRVTLHG